MKRMTKVVTGVDSWTHYNQAQRVLVIEAWVKLSYIKKGKPRYSNERMQIGRVPLADIAKTIALTRQAGLSAQQRVSAFLDLVGSVAAKRPEIKAQCRRILRLCKQ